MLEGPFDVGSGWMADTYNSNSLISTTDPYGLGTTLNPSVLSLTNGDAIVDWIKLELRDANDSTLILAEKAVLVQRDGDIIDENGNARLAFDGLSADNFFVAVKHINHLGIMTHNPVDISVNPLVDFTLPPTIVFSKGGDPRKSDNGIMLLWSGDANGDGAINAVDKNNHWRLENGQPFQYGTSKADFNLEWSHQCSG